jgi:cytochrome c553
MAAGGPAAQNAAGVTMKKTVLCALLSLPLLAQAESAAQRDFTRVLALKPDAEHGRDLFQKCAACHGPDGGGTANGSIPRIAGQHYRVLVRQVVDFRNGARWDMRMEGVATSHEIIPELQDIADVASFVSTLSRDGARGVGDGQHVERGAVIYKNACASCHGTEAQGDERRGIPRISGQHAPYLARQIYDAVDGRRPPLARSHGKRFAPLDFEDVLGLTDYLARIGWNGESTAVAPAL